MQPRQSIHTSQSNTEQVTNMALALATLDPFTKVEIERLCGVELQARPDAPAGQFFYAASISEGAFSAVQLRHSGPRQTQGYALVILELRLDGELTVGNLAGRLFPADAPKAFNGNVPPEGVVAYIVESPALTARFVFGAVDQRLSTISFRRTVLFAGAEGRHV
jgi:hypothetical protein